MERSTVTIDVGALRRNVSRMREAAAGAELWAVVKADAYGHGAADAAGAALAERAAALCVATAREGASLRRRFADVRILVLGPLAAGDDDVAREARLEVTAFTPDLPSGLPVHLKVDTGMGRFGMTAEQALSVPRENVVGVMSHLATADAEDDRFARDQLARFQTLSGKLGPGPAYHVANSAATLRFPEARLDAVRCGVALYGLSPFGDDPGSHGLEPVLAWRSHVAQAKTLAAGESTGYGRRFVAESATRIGLVPVGYGDGFRRDFTGTEILVAGNRRRVVGTISMDSFAVELGAEDDVGAPVTLIGDGVLAEEHARVAGTINYEITGGIRGWPERARREVLDG